MSQFLNTKTRTTQNPSFISKSVTLEIISAMFILLYMFNAFDSLLNLQSLKNMIRMLPHINKVNDEMAWMIVIVQATIAILIFIRKTRMAGFILAITWTVVVASYIIYTDRWPHELGGIYHYLSYKQQVFFSCLIVVTAITYITKARRESRNNRKSETENVVIFT